ncbi:MAG: NusG domain II-containing protein [Ruminiclostridium sp.]|nr:NusG domain II-containing protein [Ruminiclostridium sp.]
MKKKLFAAAGIAVAAVICAYILLTVNTASSGLHTARITSDGKVIRTIDLETAPDETFTVTAENGTNTVTVRGGKISVSEASCPDKICVQHGTLESEYLPIVCLPNRLVIELI